MCLSARLLVLHSGHMRKNEWVAAAHELITKQVKKETLKPLLQWTCCCCCIRPIYHWECLWMSSARLTHNCEANHWTYLWGVVASVPPHNAQLATTENLICYFVRGAYYCSYTCMKARMLSSDKIHDLCYSPGISGNHFNCLCWCWRVV